MLAQCSYIETNCSISENIEISGASACLNANTHRASARGINMNWAKIAIENWNWCDRHITVVDYVRDKDEIGVWFCCMSMLEWRAFQCTRFHNNNKNNSVRYFTHANSIFVSFIIRLSAGSSAILHDALMLLPLHMSMSYALRTKL